MHQFVNLDGYKKSRFADRQPATPGQAEHQSNSFHERKEAIDQGAHGSAQHRRFADLADANCEVGPKLPLRVEAQVMKQVPVFRGQIVIRERVGDERDGHEQQPFQELYGDDRIKRRRRLFNLLGVCGHAREVNSTNFFD